VARLRRIVMPGELHVIVHRGHNGQPVFVDDRDRDAYLASLREAAREADVAIHAYGLLTREVRLLATPRDASGLGRMMQSVGRRYVRGFNQCHARSGTPWEGRFRSAVIEGASHLPAAMFFVEAVAESRAGRGEAEAVRSSAAHHLAGRDDPLVEAHPAYWALGNTPFEREAAYGRFVAHGPPASQLAAILHAAMHGWVVGSDAFLAQAEGQAQRRPRPASPGRPRMRHV
jgi:putative transposase